MSSLNPTTCPERPAAVPTLRQAKSDGTLRALDKLRLRSQLGLVDQMTATDVRRAATLLLQRVADYYAVIQYTGPGYVYGRVDSTWPSALYAEAELNYSSKTWSHREMGPCHPSCPISRVHDLAGWVCLQTALLLAVEEMACEIPEAKPALDQARYLIDSMASIHEVSGVRWSEARRRMRTAGIRKLIARMQALLPTVPFGLGCVRPLVLSPNQLTAVKSFKGIREWSLPVQEGAAA